MKLFHRKPDYVKEQIETLELALRQELDSDVRKAIIEELDSLYDLKAKEKANKPRVSPDTLFKGAVVVAIAAAGYIADKNGSILPKWGKADTSILKL